MSETTYNRNCVNYIKSRFDYCEYYEFDYILILFNILFDNLIFVRYKIVEIFYKNINELYALKIILDDYTFNIDFLI